MQENDRLSILHSDDRTPRLEWGRAFCTKCGLMIGRCRCVRDRERGYCPETRQLARGSHRGTARRERRRYWHRMAKRRGWRPGR